METVYDKAQKLNSKNFKLLIGVKKETFQLMLEHLNSAYQIQHRKGGRPRSLPMEDQLIMTLRYLRYYPTQRLLAFDFGVGVATVNAIITWVEDTLRASGSFDLDHLEAPSAAVAIDVTESPIQRPNKTKAKIILVKRNDHHTGLNDLHRKIVGKKTCFGSDDLVNCSCEFPFFLCFFLHLYHKGETLFCLVKNTHWVKKETIQDLS
ncbi:transposase [Streptococcus pneumoniae]|nr:transposase [Streptococcus pneumoniae]